MGSERRAAFRQRAFCARRQRIPDALNTSPVQAVAPYPYSRPVGGFNEEGEVSRRQP